MREVAEAADHVQRLDDRQLVQQGRELGRHRRRVVAGGAAEADRRLADRLDAREAGLAGAGAQHVAQQAAEETRVLAQREILVVGGHHALRLGELPAGAHLSAR